MNMHDLMAALTLMGQGMLGIFIVMIAIAGIVTLFSKFAK